MKEKKKFQAPSTPVLMLILIIILSILTYIVPAGSFDRIEDPETGIVNIDVESFHFVDRDASTPDGPQSEGPFQMFVDIYDGLVNAADLIFLIFIGCWVAIILTETGAFTGFINAARRALKTKTALLIPGFIAVYALDGFQGEMEGLYPLIGVFIGMCIALGYDAIVGIVISAVAAVIGFNVGGISFYNTGIAQTVSGLPLFSGLGFRLIVLAITVVIWIAYTLVYCRKIKKDPSKSVVYDLDFSDIASDMSDEGAPFTWQNKISLILFVAMILWVVYACQKLGWYFSEISGLYIVLAIALCIINKINMDQAIGYLVDSFHGMASGCLVIGMARGLNIVLTSSGMSDTIVYYLYLLVRNLPSWATASGFYFLHLLLGFIMPSASGMASTTMPIIAPVADLAGVTRQTACLAYSLGHGYAQLLWPTNSIAIICGLSKIPLGRWYKFFMPLFVILSVAICLILTFATITQWGIELQ